MMDAWLSRLNRTLPCRYLMAGNKEHTVFGLNLRMDWRFWGEKDTDVSLMYNLAYMHYTAILWTGCDEGVLES